ncbi:MAG TPA: transcriptional repressor LexA [Terriglobales bacterium]|nr:transcriptional repressor LexA [Terriglobales bacterium]
MGAKRQCELYLLRFLPHELRDDFVTVGLMLRESDGGFAEVRITRDWRMLQCMAPEIELEWFALVEDEIRARLNTVQRREDLVELVGAKFGTRIDVAPTKAVVTSDPEKEMEMLTTMYLAPVKSPPGAPFVREAERMLAVDKAMKLPLVGRIAAGRPIEAIQNVETISLENIAHSEREVFALEVRGESMQDEAILDGDYVLVEKKRTARNGELVVALVEEDDATLKRYYREGEQVRLQPSNAAMKPLVVPAETVRIQGRVIGVMRRY